MTSCYSVIMSIIGMLLCLATYLLLSLHVYAYFSVIALVLKKRLGVFFGLVWIAIGMSLLYNIIFNHFWAMLLKPGSPKDLVNIEILRKEVKNRESRKAAKVQTEESKVVEPRGSGTENNIFNEDDRFEGLQKDVKRLMKYRTKTMGNLQGLWNRKCS